MSTSHGSPHPIGVSPSPSEPFWVVLTGNPNCGKTTLFNSLTGLRARVGNYAGVTVERKEGVLLGASVSRPITILDLPGTYSLSPQSLDEQIARDVLFQRLPEVPAPGLVVVVIDASNLQRNLYYATQVIELGHPTVIALNMVDVASQNGVEVDAAALATALGVPVVPMVASRGQGVENLRKLLITRAQQGPEPREPRSFLELPSEFGAAAERLEAQLEGSFPGRRRFSVAEAVLILSDDKVLQARPDLYPAAILSAVVLARSRLEKAGVDWRSAAIEARYARAAAIQTAVTRELSPPGETLSDRLDGILTHRVWGLFIFVGLMAVMFESIFSFAQFPMDLIKDGFDWVASMVGEAMGPGDLSSLLTRGIIKGVGSVVVFLPQICLLFLFISLLEDTGYMARAAFLMDRLMSRVGLHGKSFIPMLSSFACAIPGIMATRTIESPKDRLVTILVAPLMSCSARLPVYTVLIAACIPNLRWLGIIGLPGITLLGMYLLGIAGAMGMAWLFKKTLFPGEPAPLILELPPYKLPVVSVVLRHMWERSKMFLRRAGTVILGINILLWFLASYPHSNEQVGRLSDQRKQLIELAQASGISVSDLGKSNGTETNSSAVLTDIQQRWQSLASEEAGEKLRTSYAGRAGRLLEPILSPLGFDWKIGVGIVASFAAREVFVSTMSVVYNAGTSDSGDERATSSLAEIMKREKRADGSLAYTPLTGITLMVFYVFAMQCVSTVAVVRRETNSWRWPLFQWFYMTGLAWILAFVTYQGGRLMGWG